MSDSTPICRCRVLYLGSAVPRQSKDGLQGIQEPLRSLYPSEGAVGAKGIDSWLSVWSNGILLENVDENLKQITRFFPIESLHYCAAVRQVLIPERGNSNPEPKFLPLDSPFARMPRAQHPPIFAAILRRTTGIKVLECHVFICKREAAANALVRCCFHAYADNSIANSYARQVENGSTGGGAGSSVYGTLKSNMNSKSNGDLTNVGLSNGNHHHHIAHPPSSQGGWRSRAGSTTTLNSNGRILNGTALNGGESNASGAEGYTSVKNFYGSSADLNVTVDDGVASIYNDENHKVWNGSQDQLDRIGTESPYEIFTGSPSTLGRPARARQISTPIDVPPPPFKEENNKNKREKKISKSSTGSHSLSSTLMRPTASMMMQRGGMPHSNAPGSVLYGPPVGPHAIRQYHTISHRALGPPGPSLAHLHHPGPHGPRPPLMHPPPPMSLQMPLMMPQQYATLQPNRSTKKKKKNKKGGIPVGMPIVPPTIVPPMYVYNHGPHGAMMGPPASASVIAQSMAISNRKLAASMGNGLDESGTSGAESPGGTGIYRRKGHLNERAFSYSIRQEHRSRSHGSLASLQFNPPDMKKEQEIAQMVAGLELKDNDDLSMSSATLKRKQMAINNGALHHQHHHQAVYGNAGAGAIYGNAIAQPSGFGKPRR